MNENWISRLTRSRQMSEAFILSVFLAFSGGFQDAYTYMVRDGVFANAQTGNIVLMSTHLMEGHRGQALHYLLPVLAFALGVFAAERIEHSFKRSRRLHWRQGILLGEIVILTLVGFLPASLNVPSNMLVSFSCAMQVQSFRRVGGHAYASTMCIGNLRAGTDALSTWLRDRDRQTLGTALHYFGIILIFAVGAGIGGTFSPALGIHSIWICDAFLLTALGLMQLEKYRS